MGEAQCHHFGGVVSWIGGKQLKKIVEFSNYFFLGWSAKLNKTLEHRPRTTPFEEAPGGTGD